jgi:hypothetical protein
MTGGAVRAVHGAAGGVEEAACGAAVGAARGAVVVAAQVGILEEISGWAGEPQSRGTCSGELSPSG